MAKLLAARRLSCGGVRGIPFSDPMSVMNRLFCGWVVRDRFNILNKYQPFVFADGADPIPTPDPTLTIADICDAKAQEILSTGQHITVMWSGGVDSTAIVAAFLRNGIAKDQLTIAHAPSSVEEYPWMFKHLQEQGYTFALAERLSDYINTVSDGLIVSGWCADQLFGSNIHLRNLDLYNLPWIDGMKQAFVDRKIALSAKSFDVLADVWGNYAEALGVKIEQWCEFAWLYNFGCKWSYVSEDTKLSLLKQESRDRVVNFFEDQHFQSWSMAHVCDLRDVNVNRIRKYYKRPLKQYIYSYTADPDYLLRKGKVNSWALVYDKVDYKYVETKDTDGYHVFKAKENVSLGALQDAVAKRYLKEKYL